MNSESHYLDQIEEARTGLRIYRTGIRWATTALLVSIGSVLTGAFIGGGGLTIALCWMGALGILASLMFGGIWLTNHMEMGKHPERALRKAEREHRDYVMRRAS